ncbi:YoaK family protein [Actinophytocola sp.]|uniref:YoaK family protein n=1 Tax=Actinophytocola sp. TaxID=1872138 RepID=UPI002D3FE752|nr:YoaK family protein [Actinophytocola sp.]HYQ63157.1 YoaK family protein [Actinophytocola sp.]
MDAPVKDRTLVALLLVLTGVTGLIDAVSYLRLGHVFVANMTGNVVFLGLSLYPGGGLSPAASAVAIGAFLAGALLGGRLATMFGGRPRRWLALAFTTQAVIIAVTAIFFAALPALVATVPLAVAFGLQNATVRRLAARDLTTTVLTQTLTGLAADSVLAGGSGQNPYRRLWSVVAMLAGAATGALLLQVTVTGVLVLAAALVALTAAGFAFARP